MPFYDFKCNECSEIFSISCRIAEKDNQQCPSCKSTKYESHHTAMPAFGDPVRLGVRKIDDGFREVLSRVGSTNGREANLKDKLSR
jgi:putative FmdB family regulatory protein